MHLLYPALSPAYYVCIVFGLQKRRIVCFLDTCTVTFRKGGFEKREVLQVMSVTDSFIISIELVQNYYKRLLIADHAKLSKPVIKEEVLPVAKAKSFPNSTSPSRGGIMDEKLLMVNVEVREHKEHAELYMKKQKEFSHGTYTKKFSRHIENKK